MPLLDDLRHRLQRYGSAEYWDGRQRLARLVLPGLLARAGLGPRLAGPGQAGGRPLIVSLTSFPARIGTVWRTIESLFHQTRRPDRIVLVLSRAEFPDPTLPRLLELQRRRGLEVLWIDARLRSYGKLLPVRAAHPEADIVTVDDDMILHADFLATLLAGRDRHPGAIVGQWGVVPQADPAGGWRSYVAWPVAAPGEAPGRVVLLGSGGVLYPAGLQDPALLLDAGRARRVCPTADDLWFWAVAVRAGVPRICLDGRRPIPVKAQMRTPALRDRNHLPDGNDAQFAAVIAELALAPLLRGAAV